jgi:hypothetical protein
MSRRAEKYSYALVLSQKAMKGTLPFTYVPTLIHDLLK